MDITQDSIHRILVIKLRGIGDVLLSTIVLENLRSAFPMAQIDFLTEKPSRYVLEDNPAVNDLIIFDKTEISSLGLIKKIRENHYDLVFDLFGNPRTALVTFCSGARVRVGYPFRGRQYAYNIHVPSRGGEVHNTQFNLDALEAVGIPVVSRSLVFPLDEETKIFAEDFFITQNIASEFVVGFSVGSGWDTKQWGVERFARLGDLLIEKHNAKVLILWGPGEEKEIDAVKRAMKNGCIVPPLTSLRQLGALLKRCSMVISNDSGPMHISAALHIPTLGIFGPTRPDLQGPFGSEHGWVQKEGLECLGCNLIECPIGHPCMNDLSAGEVLAAAEKIMERNGIHPK
jgi:heptosyltransferase-3